MSETKPLRLFLAASVPADQLEWLHGETASLRERWPAARWIPPANQHVTLKFLGSTPPDRLGAVLTASSSAAGVYQRCALRLAGLGVFPNLRRARVLWAGIEDPDAVLTRLAADLDAALEPLGYPTEGRPYRAHLTLARFKTPLRIEELPLLPKPPEAFSLAAVGLWWSHLSPRGATYELLEELPLGHAT